ncbi:MAG: electron transfer flavoprotein subunit alpha [Candidatus Puniceispirillum sp.]|nr:electron transfer flavoprotein subunit alpha [Candidatus Puniceispirillum sp.]
MSILLIAEHTQNALAPSTLCTLTAASKIGGDITVLVAGHGCEGAAKAAAMCAGVTKVIHVEDPNLEHAIAESVVEAALAHAPSHSHILAPGTTFGKNILPRLAARLDVSQVSDVVEVISPDTFVHPIYAGNAMEHVKVLVSPVVATIRPTAFAKAPDQGGSASTQKAAYQSAAPAPTSFVSREVSKSERPELTAARVVVSGGRALQSKENFVLIEKLADTLGAAIGASRAAVDAGYVPNDYQVGQTGKVVAPELYIAIGISGAIQHLAGMKDSKVIVAINKDADAPIFQIADYALVGDLFTLVPELTSALEARAKAKAS